MSKLRCSLLAIALALSSSVAHAQTLPQLIRTTSTTGLNDSALTLISDSAVRSRAATIAQFRKALSVKAFDSLVTTKLTLTGATITGTPTWSSIQTFAVGQKVDSATGAARSQTLTTSRALWGQSFDGSAAITGSLTSVGDITGGTSSMAIQAGTGNSRTLTFKTTTNAGTAKNVLVLGADSSATFLGSATIPVKLTLTGSNGVEAFAVQNGGLVQLYDAASNLARLWVRGVPNGAQIALLQTGDSLIIDDHTGSGHIAKFQDNKAVLFYGPVSGITTLTTSSTINSQMISSAANFTGSATVQGRVFFGGASLTTNAGSTDAILPNNSFIRGVNTTANNTYALIGLDASNKVSIDLGGFGVVTSGSLTVASSLTVSAGTTAVQALTAAGNITPTSDNALDLGTGALRWRELYINPAASGVGDTYICLSTAQQVHAGATCAASTRKIKENIQPVVDGLQSILALNPVTFNYLAGFYGGKQDIGFIAEEVAAVDTRFAHYSTRADTLAPAISDSLRAINDTLSALKQSTPNVAKQVMQPGEPNSINYMAILAALVSGMKTQQSQIDSLKLLVKTRETDFTPARIESQRVSPQRTAVKSRHSARPSTNLNRADAIPSTAARGVPSRNRQCASPTASVYFGLDWRRARPNHALRLGNAADGFNTGPDAASRHGKEEKAVAARCLLR